jgi:hypothetical protein
MADDEELRFAKTQQWYVATASVTLNAAAFALSKGSQLLEIEKLFASLFVVVVVGFAIRVLLELQDHMLSVRQRSEPDAPWQRPTDVVRMLTIIVAAVGIAVVYCIFHPPQQAPT